MYTLENFDKMYTLENFGKSKKHSKRFVLHGTKISSRSTLYLYLSKCYTRSANKTLNKFYPKNLLLRLDDSKLLHSISRNF